MAPVRPRSILLVTYYYPPTQATGALRPTTMARYLAQLGHRVSVLTTAAFGQETDVHIPTLGVADEAFGAPATDARDHAAGVIRVFQTYDLQMARARMRGHDHVAGLFDSDTYSGKPHLLSKLIAPEPLSVAWAPFARREAIKLHKTLRFDAVISTSPPESAHKVGYALSKRGVPWIADIRDAWTFESLRPEFILPTARAKDRRLERRWLSAADAVVTVSVPAADDLREREIADPVVIPNGWDPRTVVDRVRAPGSGETGELAAISAAAAAGKTVRPDSDVVSALGLNPLRTTLLYTGRFGSYGRDPSQLVEAIEHLGRDKPAIAAKLELAIAGPLTEAEADLFAAADFGPAQLTLLGSVPRARALALQRRTDALLLLAQPTRSQLANFKLFEYLAAGKPILALAEGTEAGRIVGEAGCETVRADDPAAIGAALEKLIAGEIQPPDPDAREKYSYPDLARRMSDTVEAAIKRRRTGR